MVGVFWFMRSPLLERLWPRISDYRIRFVDVSFHKTSAPPSSGRRDCQRRTRSSRRRNLNFVSFVHFEDKSFRVLGGCSFCDSFVIVSHCPCPSQFGKSESFHQPNNEGKDEAITFTIRTYGAHLLLSRAGCGQGS